MGMKHIIRKVEGLEVKFRRLGYYEVNWWLENEGILYEKCDLILDQSTYQYITTAIKFYQEKDLSRFLLRWA
jgi:hypothetical protein